MDTTAEKIETVRVEVVRACAIARGEQAGSDEPLGRMVVGSKDVSARGSVRHWWYAMRWTGSTWVYPSDDRLPAKSFLANERHAKIYTEAYEGDLLLTHDRGAGIDKEGWLVCSVAAPQGDGPAFEKVEVKVTRLRSGALKLELPDGTHVERPNPRSK